MSETKRKLRNSKQTDLTELSEGTDAMALHIWLASLLTHDWLSRDACETDYANQE